MHAPPSVAATRALTSFDVVCSIGQHLTHAEASLARVIGPVWRDAASHRFRVAFDRLRLLSKFFNDARKFVGFMAAWDVILAGLPIADVLDDRGNHDGPTPCLTIIVEAPMGPDVASYLRSEDYFPIPRGSLPYNMPQHLDLTARPFYPLFYSLRDGFVVYVARFVKNSPSPSEARAVEVLWSMYTPALTLLHFQNTFQMSFMTWDRIYCLFPIQTVLNRRGFTVGNGWTSSDLTQWTERGYQALYWEDVPTRYALRTRRRFIGDSDTWCIPLEDPAMADVAASPYQWSLNSFTLAHSLAAGPKEQSAHPVLCIPWIHCTPLVHDSLAGWTYSAISAFRSHVMNRVQAEANRHGMFWRYGPDATTISTDLPLLLREYVATAGRDRPDNQGGERETDYEHGYGLPDSLDIVD